VICPGAYTNHLQGVATDDAGNIYWSFTTSLVKTDGQGALVAQVDAPRHYGDLTWHDGKVFVAVNLGMFNQEAGSAKSFVYVHDSGTLALLGRQEVPEVVHGAGGVEWYEGRFFVVGGLPATHMANYVYEYTETFVFVRRHAIASGQTLMGIQTVCRARDGTWWFGCYGKPAVTLYTNDAFDFLGKKVFNGAYGFARTPDDGVLLVGNDRLSAKAHVGSVSQVKVTSILSSKNAAKSEGGALK
jgi:hypothetical protein